MHDNRVMSILLVRHGETALNAALIVQPEDTPLNENGHRQARALAERLRGMGVTRLVSSDLLRARMTAQHVVDALHLPVETSALLAERNFGQLRGTPYSELGADIFAAEYVPPGGESWPQFFARISAAFAHVVQAAAASKGNLAVITHGLACRTMVERHVMLPPGTPPASWGNTCVTVFDSAPPHLASLVSCTAHLHDERMARGAI